jgi:hypothetical protein
MEITRARSNAHARRFRETLCGPSRGAACAVTQTAECDYRQRHRSLRFPQNDLQEQYFVILRSQHYRNSGRFWGKWFPGAGLNRDCFEGVVGASLEITDRLLAPTVRTLTVTPMSYVVRFHGKERDTGNVIMV